MPIDSRHRDLHVVDELPVPDRLEDAVAEAQDEHVLNRLLAEVVVDPEDLALLEVLAGRCAFSSCARSSRSWPNGFSTISAAPARPRAVAPEAADGRPDGAAAAQRGSRRGCPACRAPRRVRRGARRPRARRPRSAKSVDDVAHPGGELLPDVRRATRRGRAPRRRFAHSARGTPRRTSRCGRRRRSRSAPAGSRDGERVERRQQLALGQVARGAEDGDRRRARAMRRTAQPLERAGSRRRSVTVHSSRLRSAATRGQTLTRPSSDSRPGSRRAARRTNPRTSRRPPARASR